MKHNILIGETIVATILVLFLLAFLNYSPLLMPMSMEMVLVVGLVITFIAFLGFVWKEKARDERELVHRSRAGRVSFFVGTIILVIGIVVQSLDYEIDPWLVYTLIGMVFAKVLSRIYSQVRE
jgi:membrane protease YdiL (CAAX protease family)